MTSPLCQVKEGAGAWQATSGGVNVAAGAAVTIDLIDKTVRSWQLSCISADDDSDPTMPNAQIAASIDHTTLQASFVDNATPIFVKKIDAHYKSTGCPTRNRVYPFS